MKFATVFVLALVYAIFRYLVFGLVAVANLPCYVANKAFALSSVLALCAAAYHLYWGRTHAQRDWFSFFKLTLFVHLSLSVVTYSPAYYPKMFAGLKMSLYGELFMLSGVLAVSLLMFNTIIKDSTIKIELLQILSVVAIALHQFLLGVAGWPNGRSGQGTCLRFRCWGSLQR
jgi:hypothetical protein